MKFTEFILKVINVFCHFVYFTSIAELVFEHDRLIIAILNTRRQPTNIMTG